MEETGGKVIAIDGKTVKGSRDRKHNRSLLRTWSVLGSVTTGRC